MKYYSVADAYQQALILKFVLVVELNEVLSFNSNLLLIKTLRNYFNKNMEKYRRENKKNSFRETINNSNKINLKAVKEYFVI